MNRRRGKKVNKPLLFSAFRDRSIIKKLLGESLLTPDGLACSVDYHHLDKRFHLIALRQRYSKKAIQLLQTALADFTPAHILMDGASHESCTPEVDFLKEKARELRIQYSDPFIPSINKPLADAAGIPEREAIAAIALTDFMRYLDQDLHFLNYLSRVFNLDRSAIEVLLVVLLRELETEWEVATKKYLAVRDALVAFSNDLSWHKLQKIRATGNILVLCGSIREPIFDPDFTPSRTFSDGEVFGLEQEIRLYTTGLMQDTLPRGPRKSKFCLFSTLEQLKSAMEILVSFALKIGDNKLAADARRASIQITETPGFLDSLQKLPDEA